MMIEFNFKNITSLISLLISIVALAFSYFSYDIAKMSYDFHVHFSSLQNTPSIVEEIDSTTVTFSATKDAELQGIELIFPSKLKRQSLVVNTKPIRIRKETLENIAFDYLNENYQLKDSFVAVGVFRIPVMLNYSAISLSQPQLLRENRFLLFEFVWGNDIPHIKFTNTFLNERCGFPLKGHMFLKLPFADVPVERIARQDSMDVQELLDAQLQSFSQFLQPK